MRISSHKNKKLSISQEPLNGLDQICVSWELNEVLNNYVKTSKSQGLQKHFCTKFGQNDLRLDTPTNRSHAHPRTIGGGRVVRRCLARARAQCACSSCGWGRLDNFSLVYHFSLLSPPLWETARYSLKYCLKGPLSPNNQPINREQ